MEKKWNKIFKAGFFGVIFGFIAGLLTAPKKGKEMREQLKKKYSGYEKEFLSFKKKLGKTMKKVEEDVQENIDKGKKMIKEVSPRKQEKK